MSDFINARKMYLVSGALLKGVTGPVRLEPDELPANCQYLSLSDRAGWWCCPFRPIPVEQFRGQSNMTERSYNYPRAECAALYPEFIATRSAFTPLNDPATEIWVLGGRCLWVYCRCRLPYFWDDSSYGVELAVSVLVQTGRQFMEERH